MNSYLFDEAGFSRLHHLYHNESDPPFPSPEQRRVIGKILAASSVSGDPEALAGHAGFDDEIVLSSPADAKDDFAFSIVTPPDADPGEDRISILTPVSLAVIGRRMGDLASWEANGNTREMKIVSIRKSAAVETAAVP